jgi:hypothetical protein
MVAGAPRQVPAPRTVAQHFEALFELYESLASGRRLAA